MQDLNVKHIKEELDKLSKEFDAKVEEFKNKMDEYAKYKTDTEAELSSLQGAYKALKSLIE